MSARRNSAWLACFALLTAGLLVGCGAEMAPRGDTARAPEAGGGDFDPAPDSAVPGVADPVVLPEGSDHPSLGPVELIEPAYPSAGGPIEPDLPGIIQPPVYQVAPEAIPSATLPDLPRIAPPQAPMLEPPYEPFPSPAAMPAFMPQPPPTAMLEPTVPEIVIEPSTTQSIQPRRFAMMREPDDFESMAAGRPDVRMLPKSMSIELPETSNPLRSLSDPAAGIAEPYIAVPDSLYAPPIELPREAAPMMIREPAAASASPSYDPPMVYGKGGPPEAAPMMIREPAAASAPPIYDPPIVYGKGGPPPMAMRHAPEETDVDAPLAAEEAPPEAAGPMAPETSPLPAPRLALPEESPAMAESTPEPATTQPATAAALSPAVARDEGDYAVVEVFYATDRAANDTVVDRPVFVGWLMWTAVCAGLTLVLLAAAMRFSRTRTAKTFAGVGLVATVLLGLLTAYASMYDMIPGWKVEKPKLAYGSERGKEIELGTCEVSIPKEHEVSVLESPSIFRLELRETPERHVVLLDVQRVEGDAFYEKLGERVNRSPEKDTFVFVHGYNVSFEDAARRTAQIAYDLEFPGAPIFYSWPSQSSLTGYTIDENNVEWTVPHLRDFLTEVVARSGAEKVHLVAHSMGNRALANALRGLSYRRDVKQPMFNHVVLTAPDIDADVFRRDLAPRIAKTAERVTLYASSNDTALSYSKTMHGYPRAGDSGDDLVVVEGIDTIDVSAVDTSLFSLGHLYYGSSRTVLRDLFDLIRKAKPPENRRWLRPELLGSLTYWVFERIEAARVPTAVPR